jgi:hypothetical protein
MRRPTPSSHPAQLRRTPAASGVASWVTTSVASSMAACVLGGAMAGAQADTVTPGVEAVASPASGYPLSGEHTDDSHTHEGWSHWAQQPGQTLQRLSTSLRGLWAKVQPRVNVVLDPPWSPQAGGLTLNRTIGPMASVRGLQLFSDCGADGGGFRATAGLLRADAGNWWAPSADPIGAPKLSVQRLYASGVLPSTTLLPADPAARGTRPYLGAGYSSGFSSNGAPSLWRFNADLGLMSLNNSSTSQFSQLLSGDRSVDDVVRELRFRPNIKVSVGYSF